MYTNIIDELRIIEYKIGIKEKCTEQEQRIFKHTRTFLRELGELPSDLSKKPIPKRVLTEKSIS